MTCPTTVSPSHHQWCCVSVYNHGYEVFPWNITRMLHKGAVHLQFHLLAHQRVWAVQWKTHIWQNIFGYVLAQVLSICGLARLRHASKFCELQYWPICERTWSGRCFLYLHLIAVINPAPCGCRCELLLGGRDISLTCVSATLERALGLLTGFDILVSQHSTHSFHKMNVIQTSLFAW